MILQNLETCSICKYVNFTSMKFCDVTCDESRLFKVYIILKFHLSQFSKSILKMLELTLMVNMAYMPWNVNLTL